MITTSTSLLARLRTGDETQAWSRFVSLYTPVLFYWARRQGVPASDTADLVQEVFAVLVDKMPSFQYDRNRSFGVWLRTITANKGRDYFRRKKTRPSAASNLPDAEGPDQSEAFTEAEYHQMLARRALEIMQDEFEPNTWKSCWESVVAGKPAAQIAAELGISVNAVYVAKGRVLRRLREELAGLWD